ncbi:MULTISPECIES: integrase domain-containing protein [Paraburkholderia]|uniref:integrase domain-containing protein n=1 Tax=Paraburkholderia TaxID=1822464 RepID=UPI002258159B|nr:MULTISPECIES: integrase domain-containing protein [Paraburkholderia]MCX4177439.1 integrase domain-containing protein [Paraburkholderia madseniana]MDQ6465428.1 integrase domain-containing protein [Paraburkholderia madseniana]
MSRKGKLTHEACETRRGPQGAFESWKNTGDVWEEFIRFLHQHGTLPRRVRDIPVAFVMLYLQHCIGRGLKPSTVRNRATEIRVVMKRAGRNLDHVTNKVLGVATRCRDGKKRPLTDEELGDVNERARAADMGLYLLVRIQALLGLRRVEALRSACDLDRWVRLLANGARALPVRRGAKGGRPRRTRIIEQKRDETVALLQEAARYCRAHGGRLIQGRRKNREGSLNRLKALYRIIGLKGEISGHALRYTYSCTKATEDLDQGVPELEVLMGISGDLGHGPDRCRFTLRTYLLSLFPRFEKILKNGKLVGIPKDQVADRFRPPPRTRRKPARSHWQAHIKNRRAGEGTGGAEHHGGAPREAHPLSDTATHDGRARAS